MTLRNKSATRRGLFGAITSRRTHLLQLSAAGSMAAWLPQPCSLMAAPQQSMPPICIFAKPLQELSFDDLATLLAKWPVHGIEATIRKGGQIEPKDAPEQLPRLFESLAKVDRASMILASDINDAESRDISTVLETASRLGIRHFRMAYLRYDFSAPILPQLDRYHKQLERLAVICQTLNMQGLYQNHAGPDYVGAPLWDLLELLGDIPRESIGIALDTRHTTVESTTSWRSAYRAVRDKLASVYVKDAIIDNNVAREVPLGQGPTAKELFLQIKQDGFPGPISLQMEHIDHRDPNLLHQRMVAIEQDIATLMAWLHA